MLSDNVADSWSAVRWDEADKIKKEKRLVRTFREEPLGLTHLKGLSSPSVLSSTFCLFSAASALLLSISSFIFLFSSWKKDTSQRSARLSRVSRLVPCLWWSYQTFGALLSVNFSLMCRAAPLTLTAKLPQSHFAWLGGKRGITGAKWQLSHYFQNKVWIVVHLMDWWYVTKDSYTNWYSSDKYANYRTPGNNVSIWKSTNYCRKKKKKSPTKTAKGFFFLCCAAMNSAA